MAYGLKIWDSLGNVTLDTTDRITRYVTTVTISTIKKGELISIYIPGIIDDGTWFIVLNSGIIFGNHLYISQDYLNLQSPGVYDPNDPYPNTVNAVIEVFRG